jgi:hypothetical protein
MAMALGCRAATLCSATIGAKSAAGTLCTRRVWVRSLESAAWELASACSGGGGAEGIRTPDLCRDSSAGDCGHGLLAHPNVESHR